MAHTIELIQKYIVESHTVKLNESLTDKSINYYDLLNKKSHVIGSLQLTKSGKLIKYVYSGNKDRILKHSLDENEILEVTDTLIKTAYKKLDLILSSILMTNNSYKVFYEEKESKYNLKLPETGVYMRLDLSGNLLELESKMKKYEVIYPDQTITDEEAKRVHLNSLNLDLKISKIKNQEHYQLYYRINEMIKHIPASGEETGELISTKQKLKSLEPFETSSKNLFRVLGLDDSYQRVGKRNKRNCKIELWSKLNKKKVSPLNYDVNKSQLGVIKYKINKHTNQIVQINDGERLEQAYNQEITKKEAFNQALDFLFTVYPKADELFDILELDIDNQVDQDLKFEPNYMFYFNRIHDSIEIENQVAYVGVGKYTKMINKFCATTITEKELRHINVFATVSESEAKELYAEDFKMKLAFKKKMQESGQIIYELIYQPVFSNEKLNANLIDAHTGFLYES